jgi:hypothetical protein
MGAEMPLTTVDLNNIKGKYNLQDRKIQKIVF